MEHQEYAGKNLWAKDVSLDINFEQTRKYYRIFVLEQSEDEPRQLTAAEIKRRDQCLSELTLPVSCVEKAFLFSCRLRGFHLGAGKMLHAQPFIFFRDGSRCCR